MRKISSVQVGRMGRLDWTAGRQRLISATSASCTLLTFFKYFFLVEIFFSWGFYIFYCKWMIC